MKLSTLVLSATALAATLWPALAQPAEDFVFAVNQLPRGLEAASDTGNVDVRVTYSIYDTLIRRNFAAKETGDGSELVPGLAESWERVSPTELVLKLREGVKFHNGDVLTADDVLFTFSEERLLGENAVLPEGQTYFNTLKAVEKIDDRTVRFVTEQPDLLLEQRLAGYAAGIVNARAWTDFKAKVEAENKDRPQDQHLNWLEVAVEHNRWNPVGTGPYKVERVAADQEVRLAAHKDYFLGEPAADTVTFREVPELAARVAGLVAGEFDIIVDVTPDQVEMVDSQEGVDVRSVVLENSHVVVMNTTDKMLSDKRVRQALSLAIDRDLLVETLWLGKTYTPKGHQLPAFGQMYDDSRKGYSYDPEKARALLQEAGYKGERITYRMIPNYYLNGMEAAQALQEMWRAVGLNVELNMVENFKQVRAEGAQLYAWSNSYRLPDPVGGINVLWGPNAGVQKSYKFWAAPQEFNNAARKLETSADMAERRALFGKMLDIIEDEMPMTMLYNPLTSYGVRENVDWQPYALYHIDLRPDVFSIKK